MTINQPDFLWYTRCPVPTPLGIAVELGWIADAFQRHGIEIRSIADSPDPKIRASHFDHHLDWSFRQGGNVPPIWTRANGRATKLVGISWTDEFQALVTLPERGFGSVRDLVGRRFGVPKHAGDIVDFQRATALKGLVSALSLEGLTVDEVELIDVAAGKPSIARGIDDPDLFGLKQRLPYGPEFAALIRGEVEAIFVKGTQGIAAANLHGAQVLSEFGFHADARIRINSGSPRVLTVDETFAAARPDLVALLIRTVAKVGRWATVHPDETCQFVAREARASEEQVRAANGPDLHRHLGLSFDPTLVDAVSSYKDFLRDWGFLPNDFNVSDWVTTELFEAALLGEDAA